MDGYYRNIPGRSSVLVTKSRPRRLWHDGKIRVEVSIVVDEYPVHASILAPVTVNNDTVVWATVTVASLPTEDIPTSNTEPVGILLDAGGYTPFRDAIFYKGL